MSFFYLQHECSEDQEELWLWYVCSFHTWRSTIQRAIKLKMLCNRQKLVTYCSFSLSPSLNFKQTGFFYMWMLHTYSILNFKLVFSVLNCFSKLHLKVNEQKEIELETSQLLLGNHQSSWNSMYSLTGCEKMLAVTVKLIAQASFIVFNVLGLPGASKHIWRTHNVERATARANTEQNRLGWKTLLKASMTQT